MVHIMLPNVRFFIIKLKSGIAFAHCILIIATIFPHGINLGATFNPKLAYETAVVTARETRAANVQWYVN